MALDQTMDERMRCKLSEQIGKFSPPHSQNIKLSGDRQDLGVQMLAPYLSFLLLECVPRFHGVGSGRVQLLGFKLIAGLDSIVKNVCLLFFFFSLLTLTYRGQGLSLYIPFQQVGTYV